jgi:methylated-DNA-[protein]-cysteine S-methyltransferase
MIDKAGDTMAEKNARIEGAWESCLFHSPVGWLKIAEDGRGICEISIVGESGLYGSEKPQTALLQQAVCQLKEYFEGRRTQFTLPLSLRGTPFQREVWEQLTKIPYGQTRTYGEIAAAIGNPRACRAVGMANHNNSVMIVVPCQHFSQTK